MTLRDDLHEALQRSSADPGVRAIVVTGAGRGFNGPAAGAGNPIFGRR